MTRGNIGLNNCERFKVAHRISDEKINKALDNALQKLLAKKEEYKTGYPAGALNYTDDKKEHYNIYPIRYNWLAGLHTGCYLLSYDVTKNREYLDVVSAHMERYEDIIADRYSKLQGHDIGFWSVPSIVAYYKTTGDIHAKRLALETAKYFFDEAFIQKGGFVIRTIGEAGVPHSNRTMIDTLFNIPLLYWAWEETGHRGYLNAANSQISITDEFLIREDGSTHHHYQFEPYTYKPLHGETNQAYSPDSCWSRGQSWAVYGLPIAYGYNKRAGDNIARLQEERYKNLHRDVTYYVLNHLPDDCVPYWDYTFVEGDQPRDSSAGAITVCGMLEACKFLKDTDPEKEIYQNAASMMLEAIIDNYTSDDPDRFAGLIGGVCGGNPEKFPELRNYSTTYGDYFYLEALIRYKYPDWEKHW